MSSILNDIKHKIGPSEDYSYYDCDIIDAINSCFGILTQLGVGPEAGFVINDDTATWDDYEPDTTTQNLLKTYIYAKVRLIFDPPNSSYVLQSLGEQIKELEWRLQHEAFHREVNHEN